MCEKGKIFKTVILFLFLFFLFGCSHKYVDAEGESLDGKVVDSWEELDCKIVEQDERGFTLGVEVKDIIVVGDSLKSGNLYMLKSPGEGDAWIALGFLGGVGGCLGGCYYGLSNISWDGSDEEEFDRATLISFASCVTGAGMIFAGIERNRKSYRSKGSKAMHCFGKGDNICVESVSLSKQKIKISIENSDFEERYWTDEEGNVNLKFEEIIPESTEVDSVLNLIIRYYELVDTVEVICLEKFLK